MAALGGYYWGGILAGIERVAQQRGVQVFVFQGTPSDISPSTYAVDSIDGGYRTRLPGGDGR
jgi:hypothetical protein